MQWQDFSTTIPLLILLFLFNQNSTRCFKSKIADANAFTESNSWMFILPEISTFCSIPALTFYRPVELSHHRRFCRLKTSHLQLNSFNSIVEQKVTSILRANSIYIHFSPPSLWKAISINYKKWHISLVSSY